MLVNSMIQTQGETIRFFLKLFLQLKTKRLGLLLKEQNLRKSVRPTKADKRKFTKQKTKKPPSNVTTLYYRPVSSLTLKRLRSQFDHPVQALRNRGRGGISPHPPSPPPLPKFSVDVPFLLMSPLNVLFLKEVTKNVHENQQVKSRAN